MSRDEELLAQHIREAVPGTLAVVLTGELHSLLRAERERWVTEIREQQREYRKALVSARAEGFAAAKEAAASLAEESTGLLTTPARKQLAHRIRGLQDGHGEGA